MCVCVDVCLGEGGTHGVSTIYICKGVCALMHAQEGKYMHLCMHKSQKKTLSVVLSYSLLYSIETVSPIEPEATEQQVQQFSCLHPLKVIEL